MTPKTDALQDWWVDLGWMSAFSRRTLDRGRDYAERGRVLDLRQDSAPDGSIVLQAQVIGSGRHRYDCEVRITPRARSFAVDARCTCPVEVDCKHAAAVLFVASPEWDGFDDADDGGLPAPMDAPGQPAAEKLRAARDAANWERWEEWFTNLGTPLEAGARAPSEQRFGVLLRAYSLDRLLVLPAWLRPSRRANARDEFVDPRAVTLDDRRGAVPMPEGGWSREEAAALTTLLHAPAVLYGSQPWRSVVSAYVEQALEVLLAHHPAYFERGAVPLQRGAPVPVRLAWQESADGRQRLVLADAALAGHRVLRGDGYWYVDVARREYGRIEGDPRVFRQLEYAPELLPDVAAKARQEIASGALAGSLPLPVVRERGPDVHAAPQPTLHLEVQTLQEYWSPRRVEIACGWLGFDYAGTEIEPLAHDLRVERVMDGRIRTVYRDAQAEGAAIRTLQLTGLSPLTNEASYFLPSETPQLTHLTWLLRPNRNRPPVGPEGWQDVLGALRGQGFRLEYGAGFPQLEVLEVGDWHAELTPSGNRWFDVALDIDVAGKRVNLLPLLRQLLADPAFPRVAPKREKAGATWRVHLDAMRCVELPLARLRTLIEPLLEWLETDAVGIPRIHATELDALGDAVPWRGGEALRAQLAHLEQARTPRVPRGLRAVLRPYQIDGLAWLNFLADAGLGGILADDMGLGKTLQVLAHVLGEKQRGQLPHPALVIVPTSLVGNWASEAARFTPALRVLVVHGSQRAAAFVDIPRHDLVLTTYPLLRQDRDRLVAEQFSLVVLDEAQTIKNARSQAARIVRELQATRRIALTGTPLENHLGELWAEFDAVEPGLLGSARQFQRVYRTPVEKHGDAGRMQRLNRRVGALLLRRRKEDVLTELPPKTEIVHPVELAGAQRELYETLRLTQHARIQEAIRQRGFARAGIIVLDALLKLRQVCCDPRLVKLDSARKVRVSAKLDSLLELLDEAVAAGRRVLVFSQFAAMLALIESAIAHRGIDCQSLTGATPGSRRAALVKRFQAGRVPVFLISLKAGGLGLNLTAADTVIHYDPWWNPAVEAQATDRAHRIGQDKPVFVYRLICAGTVEEKIQALQARKAKLARAILEGGSSQRLRFDQSDLDALFGVEPAASGA